MPIMVDGEPVKTCPIKLLRGTDVWSVIELYADCEMMHALPEPGGVLDQPRKLMQAFRLIRDEVNKQRLEESKRGT